MDGQTQGQGNQERQADAEGHQQYMFAAALEQFLSQTRRHGLERQHRQVSSGRSNWEPKQ
jgi:hypothetical protein